jgi:hypothetical protein
MIFLPQPSQFGNLVKKAAVIPPKQSITPITIPEMVTVDLDVSRSEAISHKSAIFKYQINAAEGIVESPIAIAVLVTFFSISDLVNIDT